MNVYVWTDSLKNAYIGEFVPYTPNANTLLYLPFNWDLSNSQWKTITWSWISYESTGINKSVKLTDVSWVINWPWNLMSSVWTWDYTVSLRVKPTNWGNAMVFGNWYNTSPYAWIELFFIFWTAFSVTNKVVVYLESWKTISSQTSCTSLVWSWHNLVVTRRSWVIYLYIDNSLEWQLSYWTTMANCNTQYILNRPWWQNWSNTWALMDELIVEKAWWTVSDISNYYNLTKSNFLS